jgi:hypothetical protein
MSNSHARVTEGAQAWGSSRPKSVRLPVRAKVRIVMSSSLNRRSNWSCERLTRDVGEAIEDLADVQHVQEGGQQIRHEDQAAQAFHQLLTRQRRVQPLAAVHGHLLQPRQPTGIADAGFRAARSGRVSNARRAAPTGDQVTRAEERRIDSIAPSGLASRTDASDCCGPPPDGARTEGTSEGGSGCSAMP